MVRLVIEGLHPGRAAFIRVAAVVGMAAAFCVGLTATANAAAVTVGNATRKAGEVAKQSPKAGKLLAPGSKVSVKLD